MGLGVTSGELQSLQLNYGKAIDVDTMLQKINEARYDPTQRAAFLATGVTNQDLASKNNAQLLQEMIPLMRKRFMGYGQFAGAAPYMTSFGSMSDLTRLSRMSPNELERMKRQSTADEKTLSMSDQIQRKWQDLSIQLSRAGTEIQNVLVDKLSRLTGPLVRLSKAFTDAVKTLLDDKIVSKWIDSLAAGIDKFAKYLASDDFKTDLHSFMDALDDAAGAIYAFARSVGKLFNTSEVTLKGSQYHRINEIAKTDPKLASALEKFLENPSRQKYDSALAQRWAELHPNAVIRGPAQIAATQQAIIKRFGLGTTVQSTGATTGTISGTISANSGSYVGRTNPFGLAADRLGRLPPGTIDRLYAAESGRGRYNLSSTGAEGPLQFEPGTAKQYGLKDPYDLKSSSTAAARYLHDLMIEFHGDLRKAVAAYEAGPKAVQRSVSRYHSEWLRHMGPSAQRDVNLVVSNQAGSDLVVQTNAAGIAQ
jgi:hypothetical protein